MSIDGEKNLKTRLLELVELDFFILPDVTGKNLLYGNHIIIDFMMFPKEHLVDAGFDPIWFGVEAKHFGVPGETGKMSRFVWQCITYAQSEYEIDEENIRPAFVLGFSDVFEINENQKEYIQWMGMVKLAGLAKVGFLREIHQTNYYPNGGWRIKFSSSRYFQFANGEYHRSNYNIFKTNVGNCAN
jgi:hypothetical protein